MMQDQNRAIVFYLSQVMIFHKKIIFCSTRENASEWKSL